MIKINLFDNTVKHICVRGEIFALKKLDNKNVALITRDKVYNVNALELVNTVNDVMSKR